MDSLQKHLVHHVVQGAVQSRVIQQGARRAQPAVEMYHLVVCVLVAELCDLPDPPNHHALQDPAQRTRQTHMVRRLTKHWEIKHKSPESSYVSTPESVGAECRFIIASESAGALVS